uniref:Uncharacterized protein n=1 Tax=Oryza sativa subsp. japonica TaxID=39947 RepID=Q6ZFU3_ORYSJ|nr:hypothetical protein [Oryza sativa Japonica Group]
MGKDVAPLHFTVMVMGKILHRGGGYGGVTSDGEFPVTISRPDEPEAGRTGLCMDIFSSPSRPNYLCGPASLCYRARRLAPAGGRPPYNYTRHPGAAGACECATHLVAVAASCTAEGPAYVLGEGVSVPAPAAYA